MGMLPRTWNVFLARHGNFTPAQLAAIPPLLAGETILLVAPTASGKTEAALAPLIERYVPADRKDRGLTILYILPTRALINNIWTRIRTPLEALRVRVAVKTHDLNTFDPKRPAEVLLTTPESLDALLARNAKVLSGVRAVIIDELHTFDGTVRGDQLRLLLNRLRHLRSYAAREGDAEDGGVQFAALSATLANPQAAAGRYFSSSRVVQVDGGRRIEAEQIALDRESPVALLDFLRTFRERGWRKAIAFCNTRTEVESYAGAVRASGSPFGTSVYVHYSNLEWDRRREIEERFAADEAALCFASSTLELGIDIGDIDVALLIGAPGSRAAFVQRLGRAGRRSGTARSALFYRTPLERITFGALLDASDHSAPSLPFPLPFPSSSHSSSSSFLSSAAFRPSVAVQQIFSLLQQSPTGALRFNPLAELFAPMLLPDDLRAILGHLQAHRYLRSGRAGEWRAGERLNKLFDQQAAEYNLLSLHSNIELSGGSQIKVRDRHSGRLVANVDRQWLDRDLLTLEGRPVSVEWYDGEALWISAYRGLEVAGQLRYTSTRQVLSYDLAHELPRQLGLAQNTAPLVEHDFGHLWFHWLGDVYGRALLDLLNYTVRAEASPVPGICLRLQAGAKIPMPTPEQVQAYVHDNYRRYEPLLALGAYQHLLPVELRRRAVVEQFNVLGFVTALSSLRVEWAPEDISQDLLALLLNAKSA